MHSDEGAPDFAAGEGSMSEATPPGPSSDLNLLYVLLALQMDFVTRDALLQAMQAWVFARDRSLIDLLQEQKALTPEQRKVLNIAVNDYLESQSDIAPSSRSAEELPPTVADVLQHPVSLDPAANLFAIGNATVTGLERMRYRVLRLHARGGLGMVSVARDGELGREVALKELDTKSAENEMSRRRFIREAEITGRLEHPGIVPVYGLGWYADGRPYYVMRLIRGETLQEAVSKLHAGKEQYTLRDLLTRFVAVCNTVAYAHSRGVIHRDLKPANVMLGPYGETLVVDWGLAKVIGQPNDPSGSAEETLQVSGSSGGDHTTTREGSALGTPAYMSPEQAGGRLDEQSTATDVYGLGATLYAMITGQAPVAECDAEDVLERVQQGDWPAPRHVKAEVPRALDAICHKALALRPADRYPSVLALAADVERWLAGEPVGAYREPVRVRLGRWGRRHRTAITAIAALLVTAAVGLTAGLIAVQSERERSQILERQIDPVLRILQAGNQEKGGRYELAVRSYSDAVALLELLTAEHQTPENQNLLASTLRDLANLHHDHHDDVAARPLLQRAVEMSRLVQKAAPDVPRYRETLLDNLTRLSEVQLASGDHPGASDTAVALINAGPEPGIGAYNVARIYARCLPVAALDTTLSKAKRAERMRYYADQAIELLRQAVAKGFSDAGRLKQDTCFDPLRDRTEFKRLVKEIETKEKGAANSERQPGDRP
jgi:hypothetical protein